MKKKNLLIDSDLMMNLLENGNSYLNDSKKRSLFLGFDKIFKSVNKGFFFNTESIYEFAKNRDNPDYLSQFSPVYIKRMLDIIAQNNEEWQKIEDISESDWSALFTNETSKTKTKYRGARDLAEKRMNHYISADDIFDNESDFVSAIDYDNNNTSIKKGIDYSYKHIFRGFHQPSPYYICWDMYLFQTGESYLKGRNLNLAILKYLSLFCDWAYNCSKKKDDLPHLFFGGWGWLSTRKGIQEQDFKIREIQFLSFIKNQESHKNIDIVHKFIDQKKIHFFNMSINDRNNYGKQKYERLMHNNYILTNYGGLRWTERKNLFMNVKGPNFFKEKIGKSGRKILKSHSKFTSHKDDTIIYKTFFKDNLSRLEVEEKNLIELINKRTGIKIKKDGSIRTNTN